MSGKLYTICLCLALSDASTGEIHGLGIDFMREACEIAEKKCEFVGYKDYGLCWNGDTEVAVGKEIFYSSQLFV